MDNDLNKVIVEESAREAEESPEASEPSEEAAENTENSGIGSISFVSCATGSEALQTSSLASEPEEGGCFVHMDASCQLLWVSLYYVFFSFLSEAKPRLTRETAVDLGMFCLVFSVHLLCLV